MHINLEQFSGPLDLLLNLIGDSKLDINDLSLAEVTEQYLEYLDKVEEVSPEDLADFLVVAARLLFLKSRTLLPEVSEDEDGGVSLEEQLRLYRSFVNASKKVNKKWINKNRSVFRFEPPRKSEEFTPPENLGLENLKGSFKKLLLRIKPPKPLPKTQIDKAVSIKEKIDSIRGLLKKQKSVNFFEILKSNQNKTEVIVGFLALLELVKQETVYLKQDDSFSDIFIEKV